MSGIKNYREWLIGFITVGAIITVFCLQPIPQDPNYHNFADFRKIYGVNNFCDVFSNFPFFVVGILGFIKYFKKDIEIPRLPFLIFSIGIFFVGAGSSYYHYNPNSQTLVWDRLPMTIAFMALFSIVIGDRISEKFATKILWPLIVAGLLSIGYWHWTETQNRGDLRPYAIIQFLPMILIPLMLILYKGKLMKTSFLWYTFAAYAMAKVMEHYDIPIFNTLGFISGHSIKHLFGALAVFFVVLSFEKK